MSALSAGYDHSTTTYSPDGRLYQLEYAEKAANNSGTVVAMRVKDGVVFAVEKPVTSKLMARTSQQRIHIVDDHIAIAVSGILADGRVLIFRAREQCQEHRKTFGTPINVRLLAMRLADYMHVFTLYDSIRPFGVFMAIGGLDPDGTPQLYFVDSAGNMSSCFGIAFGQNGQAARTEIEHSMLIHGQQRTVPTSQESSQENPQPVTHPESETGLNEADAQSEDPNAHLRAAAARRFHEVTCENAVLEAARIICYVHDETRDKPMYLELGTTVDGKVRRFSEEECANLEARARAQVELEDESSDE